MAKLVLYSDQIVPETNRIDDRLFTMLPPSATVGYLPSSPDPDRTWFQMREAYYARYGAQLKFFGLETEFEAGRNGELFDCDAIHLTGGNTFRFLYWLRERDLISGLRQYVKTGGVLIGVSAGAILMTPDTATSHLCGDEPYPGLEDLSGLGLVDFAFVPHLGSMETSEVLAFSSSFAGSVYGVPDGSGIVVDGNEREFFGPVLQAQEGKECSRS